LSKTNKISAIIITYNEVVHIDNLIENLGFVDEIVVVDSFSTDGTLKALKKYNHVKTYQNKFINFPTQKNIAFSKANNDWVLFIDADERLTEKGKQEILECVNSETIDAYWAKFQYFFGEKPIKFSGFQTAKSYRLFKRSKCNYDETKGVHERLIVNGISGYLKNKILHYSFKDYAHYKEKMKLYGSLIANKLYKQGKKSSALSTYLKIAYRFFNHYIMRLGILDGKVGFQISYLNAYSIYYRYKILDELNSNASKT